MGIDYSNLPMTRRRMTEFTSACRSLYARVPEANTNTRTLEIGHIRACAAANNLPPNCSKSKEMIIRARGKRGKSACPQPPCSDIEILCQYSQLTTSLTFWRRAIACCTRYAFCVITVSATRCRKADLRRASVVRLVLGW